VSDAADIMRQALRRLSAGAALGEQEAFDVFETIMTGGATEAQIGAVLAAMQVRPGGPTVAEITGAARSMRGHATGVTAPRGVNVIDTCGTGGDHAGTFNISTAAAILAAAAGAHVAKHGNRSVTSQSGSSQVLEALGVNLQADADQQARCLAEARLCFCFAPAHHPAMKHAIGPRKELGFRTIFNLLGPLTNPAGARRQVLGVFDASLTEPLAAVLRELGSEHAMVVHGNGLDEITLAGPTTLTELNGGRIETRTVQPTDFGLNPIDLNDLRVDSVEQSAAVIRGVLAGEPGPALDITLINAAAALVVAGCAEDFPRGMEQARAAIAEGRAQATLQQLAALSHDAAR